ncbi:MAG: LCP family protein [Clostridiales bacterium]|nr:LCP family protein [Clostridiales bacterium]
MRSPRDFWAQDRTTIFQKTGWFEKMSQLQRICYILLLVFIVSWCFYLGMSFAFAIAPDIQLDIIYYNEDWKHDEDVVPTPPMMLEGVEVVLLVGADKRPGENAYRTDTIILAFFNGETNELKLLSIPRDSYVQLPGKSIKTRINEAYFYGGMPLLENTIEYTFGIEVDRYIEMDFTAFIKVVDLLKGVEIDVPRRMYKPEEGIDIQKGLQTLKGHDALGFVRFRDMPMGDIDRIANQQLFIRALAAKIAGELTIWKAPQLVNIALDNSNTNYPLTEALPLGAAILKSDLSNITMHTLPGDGKYIGYNSYWLLNKKGCINIITEITGGDVGEFNIIDSGGKATEKPPAPPSKQDEVTEEIDKD